MQLDEGFWMRWSDNFGRTFDGGRVVIPVKNDTFFALEFSIFFTIYAGSTYEIYFVAFCIFFPCSLTVFHRGRQQKSGGRQ